MRSISAIKIMLKMNSIITHTSYVIDFLDVDFDSNKISKTLKLEVDRILENIDFPDLEDWTLDFNALYTNNDELLLFRKTKSHTKEQCKEIVIHIPIPLKTVVPWGVEAKQHFKRDYNKGNTRYQDSLGIVEPTEFDNRTSYIIFYMKKAIQKCFELGFTIKKRKIKF